MGRRAIKQIDHDTARLPDDWNQPRPKIRQDSRRVSYWEKLKDPRWQRKRLEILDRDGWECVVCGAKEKTLHVHHGYYEKGVDPWDARDEVLHTLCEDCHSKVTDDMAMALRELGKLSPGYLLAACQAIAAVELHGEYNPFQMLFLEIYRFGFPVEAADHGERYRAIQRELKAVCEKFGYTTD